MGVEEILTQLLETAREQQRWQRAAVLPLVRKTVAETVMTPDQRKAFEMCDGKTSNKKIAETIGKSEATISRWASNWRDAGIAYEGEHGTQHLVGLEALGIPIEASSDEPGTRNRSA
jgi:DNA-directed RNA polymerase specialized sigma24 family protein